MKRDQKAFAPAVTQLWQNWMGCGERAEADRQRSTKTSLGPIKNEICRFCCVVWLELVHRKAQDCAPASVDALVVLTGAGGPTALCSLILCWLLQMINNNNSHNYLKNGLHHFLLTEVTDNVWCLIWFCKLLHFCSDNFYEWGLHGRSSAKRRSKYQSGGGGSGAEEVNSAN